MKHFKFVRRFHSKENYKDFVDFNYLVPASSLKSVRYYEGMDSDERYYCDFLLTFDGVNGEVLTVLTSQSELERYLNFFKDESCLLDLGIIQIETDYESTFDMLM